jgi:hypothetical protein
MGMMRFITALGTSCIILIASLIIPSCQATIEKEYAYQLKDIVWNDTIEDFKVKLVIETEENDIWIKGKSYTIQFILTVNSINFSYFDALNFSSWDVHISGCDVAISKTRWMYDYVLGSSDWTLSYPHVVAEFTAHPLSEGRATIIPRMSIKIIGSKAPHGYSLGGESWEAEEPLYINVTTTSLTAQIDAIKNLMYVLISTTVILIAITTYLAIKKTKV